MVPLAGLAAAAAPLVLALLLAYCSALPKARLLRLCSRSLTPAAALRAKRIIEASPRLAPLAVADNPNQLDTEECARRILGARSTESTMVADNLRGCLAFVADLHALKAELTSQKRAFDGNDAAHLALLRQLWEAFYPNTAFRLRDDAWMRLGFQGSDPTTDFRGMGCLALRELVHFSQVLRPEAIQLVDEWSAGDDMLHSLPLALTAINASSWLWALMLEGRLDRCFYMHGASLQTYRGLFCEMLCGFLRAWRCSPCSDIADFSRISTMYTTDVKRRLDRNAHSIAPLYSSTVES